MAYLDILLKPDSFKFKSIQTMCDEIRGNYKFN